MRGSAGLTIEGRARLSEFLESLVGGELRLLLGARRLKTGGSVQMLKERLVDHVASVGGVGEPLKFMTVDELKVPLRSRGLRVSGLKQELCERLARHVVA